ncbi:MAG TPA: hypothetical protein VGK78_13625 [Nocardioides sp.]|uniref:hypothetical protein n=1 Tax=Nocardioides sp. TaxID=35761 RepID=UPI002F427702
MALADDLPPVRWRTVLKIARAGVPDDAVVPSTAPGRESALADELWGWLVDAGYDQDDPGDLGLAVPAYVALPARDDFDDVAGRGSSLDAHTLCMLVVERAFETLGGVEVDARTEAALFGWLHSSTHTEPSAEQLNQLGSRRRVRLEARELPAGEVAASLCSPPPPAGWLDGVLEGIVSGPYSPEQLGELLEQFAAGDEEGSTRWEDCRRGFAVGGDLDLSTASPADSWYVSGLLLRWLVDQAVPVTVDRMRWAESYVRFELAFLAPHPSRDVRSPLQAHHLALAAMRREGLPTIPLAEELVLVSWLCNKQRFALDVAAFLKSRADFTRLIG